MDMKTNIETNLTTGSRSLQTPISAGGKGLKVALIVLSVTALCLAYRAANEAAALYGVLEKVQAALATEQIIKTHATTHVQISETKPVVAGL